MAAVEEVAPNFRLKRPPPLEVRLEEQVEIKPSIVEAVRGWVSGFFSRRNEENDEAEDNAEVEAASTSHINEAAMAEAEAEKARAKEEAAATVLQAARRGKMVRAAVEAESTTIRAGRVDMLNAPEATDRWNSEDGLRVIDSSRKIRCTINTDGTVADGCGKVLAYIEPNGDVGSAEMDYLGKASNDLVLDRNDQVVGAYDVGRGLVRDSGGSTIAEVSKEGVVLGNSQMQAGWVEGFTFDAMQTLAAYLHLVDPAFTASS